MLLHCPPQWMRWRTVGEHAKVMPKPACRGLFFTRSRGIVCFEVVLRHDPEDSYAADRSKDFLKSRTCFN